MQHLPYVWRKGLYEQVVHGWESASHSTGILPFTAYPGPYTPASQKQGSTVSSSFLYFRNLVMADTMCG